MKNDLKICTKCKENKSFNEYNKAKKGKYGLKSICKPCQAKESAARYEIKKDEICAYGKKYRIENKEEISERRAIRTAKDKGKFTEYRKKWQKDNPGKVNAKTARYKAAKKQRTPPWLTKEHFLQIEQIYIEASTLTRETGIKHEVDHIEPLQGWDVSGLHVPWNLRIIPMSANRQKHRKRIK